MGSGIKGKKWDGIRDQGSQARDLGSLVVGSGSVVLHVIRDSFPTAELRKSALMGRTCPRLKNSVAQLYFGVILICSAMRLF